MATVTSSSHKGVTPRFAILWLDSEVNNSEENLNTQQTMFQTFENFSIFEEVDVCQDFIETETNQPILLIVSGRLCRNIVPAIDTLDHVLGIYIYCRDKSRHEAWANDFTKVRAIVVELEPLVRQIRSDFKTLSMKKKSTVKAPAPPVAVASSVPKPMIDANEESGQIPHISSVVVSGAKPKNLLDGYEKKPLVTLEEAVAPLDELITDVAQMAWIVKQNSSNPQEGLTSDESASIGLLSMEWYPKKSSFYYVLNETLRSEDPQQIKPWHLYLKLIFSALAKLKTVNHIVYQGTNVDIRADYNRGNAFLSWEFLTCTASLSTLESDETFGKTGERTLFTIQCRSGKDIRRHAFEPTKEQILLTPGRQFQVVSCLSPGDELNIIQLEEMKSPFTFV